MGTVYEGRQIQFNRVVAIKVLSTAHLSDEQVFARFEREARSIARVNHPNVVKLIDSGFEAGNSIAYIVMEYVKGIELSNIPASELSGQFIAHIAYQVLNALAEAHAMNVIHRDLKPDNIMITNENGDPHFVKVLDFGLAALTDRAKITMSGQALGTPWYMSPEQATASAVSFSSDIYSLGCILYELATSKPPFPGNRPFNVMMQHVNAQVPPMITRPEAEISADMVGFILRCLEKHHKIDTKPLTKPSALSICCPNGWSMGNRRRASRYSKACDNSHSSPISVPISRVASRAFSVRAKCDPSEADRRARFLLIRAKSSSDPTKYRSARAKSFHAPAIQPSVRDARSPSISKD